MLRQHVTSVECFRKLYCNVTDISGDLDCIVVMFDIVQTKKKPEKHTTIKEKSQENVIATAFSLAPFSVSSSCTVLVLQPSSRPTSSSLFYIVSLVGVLKIWLEGMPGLFPSYFVC